MKSQRLLFLFFFFAISTVIVHGQKVYKILAFGDVITTGTPHGVGAFSKPPMFMKAGDVIEVEIEKIGILRNKVVGA